MAWPSPSGRMKPPSLEKAAFFYGEPLGSRRCGGGAPFAPPSKDGRGAPFLARYARSLGGLGVVLGRGGGAPFVPPSEDGRGAPFLARCARSLGGW